MSWKIFETFSCFFYFGNNWRNTPPRHQNFHQSQLDCEVRNRKGAESSLVVLNENKGFIIIIKCLKIFLGLFQVNIFCRIIGFRWQFVFISALDKRTLFISIQLKFWTKTYIICLICCHAFNLNVYSISFIILTILGPVPPSGRRT